MGLISIVSIVLGVLIVIGFLLGFLRSWKKSLIRFALIIISFTISLFLTSKVSKILMSKYVNGLVVSVFGTTIDFESVAGEFAGDLLGDDSALTNFATALLSIFLKLIAFLIIFISLFIVTLFIYWIISAVMTSKKKRQSVGDEKVKVWERFIGAGIGLISTLTLCIALFSPVFGVMNVCDKFLEEDTSKSASAYNEISFVSGKFYTENDGIGKVESYLEKYENLRNDYKKSFAGFVFTYTGADALGKITFNRLSTVTYNGIRFNFTTECVNVVNIYNIYKDNFVKTKFDMANEESVDALKEIYKISSSSEVLRTFIVDLVPKMATKWSNGEKFMNMEIPVTGDTREVVIDLLQVFKSKEFVVLDNNINVTFKAIEIANEYNIIASINGGAGMMDVVDTGNFVYDEIITLSETAEMKKTLPTVILTTLERQYEKTIGDAGDKFSQTFTQEQISSINWEQEATYIQKIITSMLRIFENKKSINNLADFGIVMDNARKSKILSKSVKTIMFDYIEKKVTDLGSSKSTILNAIQNEWDNSSYKYADLFATIEIAANLSKDDGGTKMTDMSDNIKNIVGSEDESVKNTLRDAMNNGILDSLVDNDREAGIYKDVMLNVLDNTTPETVDQDLQAGQIIVDIVKSPSSSEKSVLDGFDNGIRTEEEKADLVIETLISSENTMNMLEEESQKVESSQNSEIKNSIDEMSASDKSALQASIAKMQNGDPRKETLLTLFGN